MSFVAKAMRPATEVSCSIGDEINTVLDPFYSGCPNIRYKKLKPPADITESEWDSLASTKPILDSKIRFY